MAGNEEHDQTQQTQPPHPLSPAERHETSDVNFRAITRFGIALVLMCLTAFALLFGLFHYFQARETAEQPPAPPGGAVQAPRVPPEPRLQSTPVIDLRVVRASEDQILNGYAWVDPDHGIVRIPIDQAIDLLARRGLPARQPGAAAAAASTATVPADSGLGPIMQQPGGPLASQLAAGPAPEDKAPVAEGKAPAEPAKK